MGIKYFFKISILSLSVLFLFSSKLASTIYAQGGGGQGCACGYDGAGTLCWECPVDNSCSSSAECGGSDVCCQGQCVGSGQCGGGGGSCRNATVNCPLNSTIATNQPLYTVCQFDWGGNFCQPPGSAQLPTGCCVAAGQEGCGNTEYTTYACCPADTVDTCTQGSNYQKINGCYNPTLCNDDDLYQTHTRDPIAGVCGQECTSYKPDGSCRAGAYADVYGYVTTCKVQTCGCASTCTSSAPAAPSLPSPANGSTITTDSVVLSWTQGSWGVGCPTDNRRFELFIGIDSSQNLASVGYIDDAITSTTLNSLESGRTYYWRVNASNGSVITPSAIWNFTVNIPSDPWWQVKDGDVTTNGNLSSEVPTAQLFDTVGIGGFPGLPVFGGSFNLTADTAKISSTLWNSNTTTTQGRLFDYSYFDNLIPDDVNFNDISTLASGGVPYTDGYEWFKAIGDVSSVGDINIGDRKVILFVENGNLNINGRINVNDGVGFFGAFVDGNIVVANTVSGTPSIEGVYLSDGSFSTGAGTSQLHIRGSVASYGGVSLQRDLANDINPAELIEFGPDQLFLFPQKLMHRRTKWAEVNP